jgi:hypothetical protein
MLTEWLVTASK